MIERKKMGKLCWPNTGRGEAHIPGALHCRSSTCYLGKQGQVQRFKLGRIKARMVTAISAVKKSKLRFKCEKTKAYLDMLSLNTGVQRTYGIKSLLDNHYLRSDQKKC